ncbi:hypothetical protein V6L76_17310 [Pannonibacter sp. Pt2]|uniref:Phage tail tape measure protein n=1 Tax=Pannonibacter anstelovis TaxID=3121537 RepID=A0ABU7ZS20_9HYPH
MKNLAVSVLVNLRDRLSGGLGGLSRRLAALGTLGRRLGLDRVGRSLGNVGRAAGQLAVKIGALLGSGGGGLLLMVQTVASTARELTAMAQRAGTATQALQELAAVGSRRGVGMDALVDGLKEMQLRADEFILTGEGSAKEAFERLGLSANDLAAGLKQPDKLFEDIIGRLGQFDKAAQIRISDEIFGGTGGEQFVQMIELGTDGIKRMRAAAREQGLVFDEEQLKGLNAFSSSLQDLTERLTGLVKIISAKLAPVLTPVIDEMVRFIDANRPEIIDRMMSAIEQLGTAVMSGISAFRQITEALGGLDTILVTVAAVMSGQLIVAVYSLGAALIATPVGWFLGAMAAIAAAAYLIYDNWSGITAFFEEIFASDQIYAFGAALMMTPVGWFLASIAAIAGAAYLIYDNWRGIAAFFRDLWGRIKGPLAATWETIKTVLSYHPLPLIISNWDQITAFFAGLWSRILSGLSAAWEGIKTILSYHPLALIISNWDQIVTFFSGLGKRMADALRTGVAELLAIGGELMQALWDGIKTKIDEMMAWLAEVPGRITGVFDGVGASIGSFFGMGGDEPAPAPAPGAAGQLGRIAGAGAAASAAAYQAPAGAVAAQQQEAKVGGKVVLEVIGPAQVRSVNSTNSDAPIVMDRGQSLGAP